MIISTTVITIIILYLMLIGSLAYGFDRIDTFYLQDLKPKTAFSIVIPFRNEEKHLKKLIVSINALHYPHELFEVLFVNDQSDDRSNEIITDFFSNKKVNYKILHLPPSDGSPKKRAISMAIEEALNDWIVTTDADCILPKYWLDAIDQFIDHSEPNCIVAPVVIDATTNFTERYQALDMLSLQGTTIGGFGLNHPFLCNGANLAYKKSVFIALNGFNGNNHIASGDDIFLLEKLIKLDPKKVKYLKCEAAVVKTAPVKSFRLLIEQRVRWASKTTRSKLFMAKFTGLIVVWANLIFLSLVPLFYFNLLTSNICLSLAVIKLSIDFLLLFKTARFLNKEDVLPSVLLSSIIYPLICIYVALASPFLKYKWKGRLYSK
ncbi:MAG: glycosyltransferase [Winogradskyella sp.]|nr:glycosyltransferase [Winogradskyella sp.]